MKVVLDTCALIWAVAEPEKLSPAANAVCTQPDTIVHISPISCAEVACAAERGRVMLDRHWKIWFRHFVEMNEWSVCDINLEIIEEAYSLPGDIHNDPADRFIIATARRLRCPIVTADKKMIDYPHVETVWF
jgi:PIN domain nuclease of toxin-antitoxin system